MISCSNEQLQQLLEYTLLKPDCHSWWISKMQSGHEDTLEERYAIEFCFEFRKKYHRNVWNASNCFWSILHESSISFWVKGEIPLEEARTLQIGSVAFPSGQCISPQLHRCHRLFDQDGHQDSSSPSLLSSLHWGEKNYYISMRFYIFRLLFLLFFLATVVHLSVIDSVMFANLLIVELRHYFSKIIYISPPLFCSHDYLNIVIKSLSVNLWHDNEHLCINIYIYLDVYLWICEYSLMSDKEGILSLASLKRRQIVQTTFLCLLRREEHTKSCACENPRDWKRSS